MSTKAGKNALRTCLAKLDSSAKIDTLLCYKVGNKSVQQIIRIIMQLQFLLKGRANGYTTVSPSLSSALSILKYTQGGIQMLA